MGVLRAVDSVGEARRAVAQDRRALGDEHDLLSSANRMPMALFAARDLPAHSTVCNIFRIFQRQGL
jgi:hypothetical protein